MEQSQPSCIFLLATLSLAACSAEAYRHEADEEVYRILGKKRQAVLGKEADQDRALFSI